MHTISVDLICTKTTSRSWWSNPYDPSLSTWFASSNETDCSTPWRTKIHRAPHTHRSTCNTYIPSFRSRVLFRPLFPLDTPFSMWYVILSFHSSTVTFLALMLLKKKLFFPSTWCDNSQTLTWTIHLQVGGGPPRDRSEDERGGGERERGKRRGGGSFLSRCAGFLLFPDVEGSINVCRRKRV